MTKFTAKLTPEQRAQILASPDVKASDLAEKYGVSTQLIYNMRSDARDEARRMEREAKEAQTSRIRDATIRDLSTWDEADYEPSDSADRLYVPVDIIPDGIEYQWCASSVYGQDMSQRIAEFRRQGWLPVPAERHAGRWTPMDSKGDIVVDGLMLMERPKTWCDRAREYELRKARGQMDSKKAQLRSGDLPGVTLDPAHPSAIRTNKIRSQYERIQVPEE